jgi:hypothetical protein
VPAKKPRNEPRKSWETKPTKRRRGASGSVAMSLLNQAPQTTQQNATGFMRPGGIDSFEPTAATSVRPAPATGVGDPDRQPQKSKTTRRAGRATPRAAVRSVRGKKLRRR